ncbi:hypothetical protein LMH87_004194 [Akanthomyces muscarius]|uniref:Ubiquitin carboxyl-terminal hydrolase 19 n=1 Tax=Akanthomyces muscarius TaxID=2231603 RepID=A0A9W8Q3A7_AKAMU|nr:hypothetical protein LMH87_004194 [Akanthomyces muscarius]KAJ4145340.1 hypothetical protein LMH87_004194 [Akanthomyces muscarius]
MDHPFPLTPEDLYNLQMELKQVQYAQTNHADRILRLEKRQTDDSTIKSVWNSPFPGVLAGTPQQGPVQIPHNDVFDDSDEQGEQLLGSLHLGPAEEEPVRRGAASRANSVRFDESALHGSGWSGAQSNRHSGEFGSRPASGLFMERTLSHKSDGRHSSAGHSVHSHHSVASGRASSVGLDTAGDDDDSSSFGIPEPPISLFVLGSVPSIIRCWLTTNFAHRTLLYADVCSGSQKSTISYSLLEELDLVEEIEKDVDGICRARLQVYFAEAVVTRRGRSSEGSEGLVPSMSVAFEIAGSSPSNSASDQKPIRVFIGSDALRAHCADILFSKNILVLYGNDRDRLRVPFVRPEDDEVFRHVSTTNVPPEKQKLNATAAPFVLPGKLDSNGRETRSDPPETPDEAHVHEPTSPTTVHTRGRRRGSTRSRRSTNENKQMRDSSHGGALSGKEDATGSESSRRESSAGIWGSWRHGPSGGHEKDAAPISGYQPAPSRSSRGMKALKPGKPSSSAKTGAAYEAPLPSRADGRRKSQVSVGGESVNGNNKKDAKRSVSATSEARSHTSARDKSAAPSGTHGANPVGVASAFSWMTPGGKPKSSTGQD